MSAKMRVARQISFAARNQFAITLSERFNA